MVHEIKSGQIAEVLENHTLVILNFGADWCIDCRRAAPFYAKFSDVYTNVYFTHTNVDEDETLRPKFEVAHIPTMIFYRNGKEIDRIVEVQTPSALKAFIDQCMTA